MHRRAGYPARQARGNRDSDSPVPLNARGWWQQLRDPAARWERQKRNKYG